MAVVPLKIRPDDAATVKDGWQVHRQRDFRGGETQTLLPETIGRNQLTRMENVILFTSGYLSAFFQTDTQIAIGAYPGLCLRRIFGGVYNYYHAPGDDTIYTGTLDTSLDGPTDIAAGVGSALAGSYINGLALAVLFLAKHYALNPNPDTSKNGIINLDDLTLIAIPGKTAEKLRVYANRLWIVNSDGTIQISDNGDATTWDPLNILWLPNQEPALDFVPIQGGAIVYGASSIYATYGSDYRDISFVPLQLGKQFTRGNAEVNGVVYILSTEGLYAVTLNGAVLLPHNQQDYFQSIFPVLAIYPESIIGVHLQRFRAIMFSWSVDNGGSQSLVYYYSGNGGYSKANMLLPGSNPVALALNDVNTDFILGTVPGTFAKSSYPTSNRLAANLSVLQTRHEDADSTRTKIWQSFGIRLQATSFGATIEAFLDYSDVPILVVSNVILSAGDNVFDLNSAEGLNGQNFPKSVTISFRLTFNNTTVIVTHLMNESSQDRLTDEDNGNQLVFDSMPGNFIVQELRVKYCLSGPDI
jgi:hypothetical protein